MVVRDKAAFVELIKSFGIKAKFVVIKPNWVDDEEGNYTEPEILEWLCEAFPQKKIVVESYTPWRGKEYQEGELGTGLESGKRFWDFYREMDKEYLEKTGTEKVLKKFDVSYLNVTNEYWSGRTVAPSAIESLVKRRYKEGIKFAEFYSFVPQKLYDVRGEAVFVSLAKIKLEEENKNIVASLSLKNVFGLIPHPSRREPYHGNNHTLIPQAVLDINKVYTSVFEKNLWINEGIKSLVRHYCEDNQSYEKDRGMIFAGTDPVETDAETCKEMGVEPERVPYLTVARGILGVLY